MREFRGEKYIISATKKYKIMNNNISKNPFSNPIARVLFKKVQFLHIVKISLLP